ncbi:MAG: beta-ketoacyl synthase N-terminal-like domain-containing protein [Acidimicrobiales bacterium]
MPSHWSSRSSDEGAPGRGRRARRRRALRHRRRRLLRRPLRARPIGPRQIEDFDPTPWFESPKDARRTDRFAQMAVVAAEEALAQAGAIDADPARRGTFIGTGVGGIQTLEEQIEVRIEKGERRVSPFLVPMMMANAAAATLSMRYGWQGPCENTVTAAPPEPTQSAMQRG